MDFTPQPHIRGGVTSPPDGTNAIVTIGAGDVNTFIKIPFSFSVYDDSINLSATTNSEVEYGGALTKSANISTVFDARCTVAGQQIIWQFRVNDNEIGDPKITPNITHDLVDVDKWFSIPLQARVPLSTNDKVSLYVRSPVACTIRHSQCTILVPDTY